MRGVGRGLLVAALFTSLFALSPAAPATAAGVVGDGSPGSCTEAALNSALAGGGLVTFNCHPDDLPLVLTSQKVIANNTQIDGGGVVTLAGDGDSRLFDVMFGATLRLAGITLTNGITDHNGAGAISNFGTLEIIDSTVSGNKTFGVGGAINNSNGAVTVINSTFSGNFAADGGGIYNRGSLTVINSTFSGNRGSSGGAIVVQRGSLEITDSTISDNRATAYDGGAICISNSTATATVTNSTIIDNSAHRSGGGIYVFDGSVTVIDSTLSGNAAPSGGAIHLSDGTLVDSHCAQSGPGTGNSNTGKAAVINSTLSANIADSGGGLNLWSGSATVTNSTLSGNRADFGGGIHNRATVALINSTLSHNNANSTLAGGGIDNSGSLTLQNTVVANSPGGGNCGGPDAVTSLGGNLSDDATCALAGTGDLDNVDDGLGPLADNGGPTLTHLPQPGSLAIDSVACLLDADQRGISRPQGDGCDIGSVELRQSSDVLCASRYTGAITSSLTGSCAAGLIQLQTPPPDTLTLCISPYTGAVIYPTSGVCAGPWRTHSMPADGDLLTCVSRYTGKHRAVTSHTRCTSTERPAFIAGTP